MKKLTVNDPETRSTDILVENIEQLKALFPEAFTEGKIDFDVLKQLLGGVVDEREEKYGLNWHGKWQSPMKPRPLPNFPRRSNFVDKNLPCA